jgi:hypothetical protein
MQMLSFDVYGDGAAGNRRRCGAKAGSPAMVGRGGGAGRGRRDADELVREADELARFGVPAFMGKVEKVFRAIAKLTKVLTAVSIPVLRFSSLSFSGRSRSMPLAALRRSLVAVTPER